MPPSVDWSALFDVSVPERGATQEEIASLVATWSAPLTDEEVATIHARHLQIFPDEPLSDDPRLWRLPTSPLPASYLDFLRWSNGGEFWRGERCLQLFSAHEVRMHLLDSHLPQRMLLSVPYALNGGGGFYLFDMRQPPVAGEYPILSASCGCLHYDEAIVLGSSLLEVCSGTTDPVTL